MSSVAKGVKLHYSVTFPFMTAKQLFFSFCLLHPQIKLYILPGILLKSMIFGISLENVWPQGLSLLKKKMEI